MKDEHTEDAFVGRVASRLREPLHPDDTFEARAMQAVRAAAREPAGPTISGKRSWWMRRSVSLTPVAALAMAAGIAAVAIVASLQARPSAPAPAVIAAKTDTVHFVRFMLVDPAARQVALVGTFNQWQKQATLLEPAADAGAWTISIALPPGRHEYAFIVRDANGERWVADRFGQRVRDDYGVESSVVSVGNTPST